MQPATTPPWASWQRWVNARQSLLERLHRQHVPLFEQLGELHGPPRVVDWNAPKNFIFVPNQIRYNRVPYEDRKLHVLFPPTLPPSWLKALESEIAAMKAEGSTRPLWRTPPPTSTQWRDAATATLLALGALLAVLLLAATLADKYYDLRLFKHFVPVRSRRRQSRPEWQRPTVAASLDHQGTAVDATVPDFPDDNDERNIESLSVDLPPPYSECTADISNPTHQEEPPPPYSSCLVTFSNHKDGIPAVHFYNSQRKRLFCNDVGESSSIEGVSLDVEQTSDNQNQDSETLVFENGRVIERNPDVEDRHINFGSDSLSRSRIEEEVDSSGRSIVV